MILNPVWKETVLGVIAEFHSFKGRNQLALIGIFIGTAAVIAILHVGHNARNEAVKQFEESGTDVLGVMIISNDMFNSISIDDILKIPDEIPNVIEANGVVKIWVFSYALVGSL